MLRHVRLIPPFVGDGGHAFVAPIPEEFTQFVTPGEMAVVTEDGKALGPADTQHQQIRDFGQGRFSLWGSHVYFSASDNTNCNDNGREYAIAGVDFSHKMAADKLSGDDEFILQLINDAHIRNNNFFLNFFGYYNGIMAVLDRHGIPFPKSAIEIGTGARPYTALRFLVEGVERFVANDVMPIDQTFPADFVRNVTVLLDMVKQSSSARLKDLAGAGGREADIKGLEIHHSKPFEDLDIPGNFDLIFSTSVLEHVMKPREVVQRMRTLLRSGGHAWHGIDLRDHRDQSRPVDFLQMTAEEYAAVNTENRLRASDWFELFDELGFELMDQQYSTLPPGCISPNNSDYLHLRALPTKPWVDEQMRARFKPPFDKKELVDLSLLGINLLYRKP